ncbi:MAG: hypothetical protein M1827_007595 [Pycnora praestabilis]|nr:MAG: hypothetical protein M1827_007595 [Pycnora praestabilis]
MAPNNRRQTGPARNPRAPVELPSYQPPVHALTPSAQRLLTTLPQTHNLKKLRQHLETANGALTEMAGDVTDRLIQKQEYHRRRKVRRAQQGIVDVGDEDEENRDREIEEMEERVMQMTRKMEESTRRVIDNKFAVECMEMAVVDLGKMGGAGGGTGTQSTMGGRSQRRRRRISPEGSDEESTYEDEGSGEEEVREKVQAPSMLFQKKVEELKKRYEAQSMQKRYAANNNYIGFVRIVHDARNPGDDAPPLPNASTWFGAEPASSSTTGHNLRNNAAVAEDSDDDIAIERERISTKCPLTLKPFLDPVTSRKCPHSFEKEAIMSMISESAARVGGSGRRGDGQQAVQCPICEMMLTNDDLYTDPLLIRRIKRIQAAENIQDNSDSDPDAHVHKPSRRHQAEEIEDEEDGVDISTLEAAAAAAATTTAGKRARSLAPRIKAEKLASSIRQPSLIPSTQAAERSVGRGMGEGSTSSRAMVVDMEDPGPGNGNDDDDDDDE